MVLVRSKNVTASKCPITIFAQGMAPETSLKCVLNSGQTRISVFINFSRFVTWSMLRGEQALCSFIYSTYVHVSKTWKSPQFGLSLEFCFLGALWLFMALSWMEMNTHPPQVICTFSKILSKLQIILTNFYSENETYRSQFEANASELRTIDKFVM